MLAMTTIFSSKMEGLPPTSNIKMIDIWLILCQLVPFAQVVLLTVKENLREQEQEENLTLEKVQIQEPVENEDNTEVHVEDDPYPREAWTISQLYPSTGGSLKMLTMIGRFLIRYLNVDKNVISEKKVIPLTVLTASIIYFSIAASFYFSQ